MCRQRQINLCCFLINWVANHFNSRGNICTKYIIQQLANVIRTVLYKYSRCFALVRICFLQAFPLWLVHLDLHDKAAISVGRIICLFTTNFWKVWDISNIDIYIYIFLYIHVGPAILGAHAEFHSIFAALTVHASLSSILKVLIN